MWNIPLGMNVKDNPLVNSPYVIGDSGDLNPIGSQDDLLTESGLEILTEDGLNLATE